MRSEKTSPDSASPPARRRWVLWASLFYGALAAVAWLWNGLAGTPWAFSGPEAAQTGVRWGRDVAGGVALAAGMIGLSAVITSRTSWGEDLARELGRALGPLSIGQCTVLAAWSGFAEELFFRGTLQPRIGWLAASLLFGLVHFVPRRELWPWTGFAVLAGGLLGGVFAWTGNLVAPVVAHAGLNAVNLRLLSRRYGHLPPVDH